MEIKKLKEFAIKEFVKRGASPEVEFDETAREEFIAANIDPMLFDKLADEFCEMNPQEFAELKLFDSDNERLKKVQDALTAAQADGTLDEVKNELTKTVRYQQVFNHAGLAYLCDKAAEYIAEMEK